MKERRNLLFLWLVAPITLLCSGCGSDFFGTPPRVKADGFRAVASIEENGNRTVFDIAVRGTDLRCELSANNKAGSRREWPILVVRRSSGTAFELNPASRQYRMLDIAKTSIPLSGYPLTPGFSERDEAKRLGVIEYARESDTVFAGNACQLWRFDDRPEDPASPATTFWVAPALDSLVVRVDRETPDAVGKLTKSTIELRNVRAGAKPSLFEIPSGFKQAREEKLGGGP